MSSAASARKEELVRRRLLVQELKLARYIHGVRQGSIERY
jgi:hypothetical protein